jgi:sugar phosphate isomerase/epimerase
LRHLHRRADAVNVDAILEGGIPQMSTPDGQREPADWAKLFGILANAGYRGYVSLETDASSR